nr:ParB N-terminal domain-containing protein [Francisella tularensis]
MQLQELNEQTRTVGQLFELPSTIIKQDANPPRKTFKNISSLADSLKKNGVIQTIIVTEHNDNGLNYIIVV